MKNYLYKFPLWALFIYIVVCSCLAFQKIAWGTGVWYREYSAKWGVLFFSYLIICACIAVMSGFLLWGKEKVDPFLAKLIVVREKLGSFRWFLIVLIFLFPVYFFQYTAWGLVFNNINFRLLTWFFVVSFLSFIATTGGDLFDWKTLLVFVLLTSSEFVIAIPFMSVTGSPFSLGWSEGNRMWDYSILFGRYLYDYPVDKEIFVLLDVGRQFVGGLPFIIPGISIEVERFWVALTIIIPYLMFGFAAFLFVRPNIKVWLFGCAWVLIFLKQGPIHPPLILSAMSVVLLWRRPLWLATPLIAITGYLTEESRFTWIFAACLWIVMLEMAGATLDNGKLSRQTWIRTILLGFSGFVGAQFGQKVAGFFVGHADVNPAASVGMVVSMVSTPSEPLLWYRLLPNGTYGVGVLVGLLIATLPLIVLLIYFLTTKGWWQPNIWQGLAMAVPLTAFLAVGLIVSTKIGGGGDLHNMDMFLVTLVFIVIIVLQKGGTEWLARIDLFPSWVKFFLLLLFIIPGLQSLSDMRPYDFGKDISWLMTLTDSPVGSSLDMYPSREVSDQALKIIQEQVDAAISKGGEVLFLDQRQLLTFGYITDVPLIPEYEKKVLMTRALGSNLDYFEDFYHDLEAHRFQLIVSEPLRTPIKDSSFEFGEENNAWVKWVSIPVLCYYEPQDTLKEVNVQLLVPKNDQLICLDVYP